MDYSKEQLKEGIDIPFPQRDVTIKTAPVASTGSL